MVSLIKMKVYIEDAASGDMIINDIPCRQLGTLKNGEEKTFGIENGAAKLFVIADKASRNFCNELYQIPEGEDDILLSGRNHFNPTVGNPFRFDGVTDEAALANRKKSSRIGLIIFIAAVFGGAFIGVLLSSVLVSPQVFSSSGMTITLTEEFYEVNPGNYTVCFDSEKVAVLGMKTNLADDETIAEYTVTDFGNRILGDSDVTTDGLKSDGDLVYFEYQSLDGSDDADLKYLVALYKTEDAFWTVQFVCYADEYDSRAQDFVKWAKSVKFTSTAS